MDAVDACYHFAGIAGVDVAGKTFRRLWQMAEGRNQFQRRANYEVACIVHGIEKVDAADYLFFGVLEDSGAGGPVNLESDPDLKSEIEKKVASVLANDPNLSNPETFR